MLVRFNKSPTADNAGRIIAIADSLGVWAAIKWESDIGEVRFDLKPRHAGNVAPAIWEKMIQALLEYDSEAFIKTTRAIYRGKADYLKQTARNLKPLEVTMKHTPTPWKLRQSTRLGYWFADYQQGGEGYTVTKFDCDEENAAFIVRSVNSHDALVKAVEWSIAALEKSTPHKDTLSKSFYHRALADCSAALQLAKAEP